MTAKALLLRQLVVKWLYSTMILKLLLKTSCRAFSSRSAQKPTLLQRFVVLVSSVRIQLSKQQNWPLKQGPRTQKRSIPTKEKHRFAVCIRSLGNWVCPYCACFGKITQLQVDGYATNPDKRFRQNKDLTFSGHVTVFSLLMQIDTLFRMVLSVWEVLFVTAR